MLAALPQRAIQTESGKDPGMFCELAAPGQARGLLPPPPEHGQRLLRLQGSHCSALRCERKAETSGSNQDMSSAHGRVDLTPGEHAAALFPCVHSGARVFFLPAHAMSTAAL